MITIATIATAPNSYSTTSPITPYPYYVHAVVVVAAAVVEPAAVVASAETVAKTRAETAVVACLVP